MTELNGRTKPKQTGLQFEATLTNVTLIQTCAHLTSFLYSPLIQSHINKNDECTTLFPQGLRTLMCTVSNEILINISECCTVDSSTT